MLCPPGLARPQAALALLALLLVSLLAPACGDDESSDGTDDATTPTEASDTTLSPEAEVEATYLAYWDMAVRQARSPNPDDPELRQRASGDALASLVDGLTRLQSDNQHTEPGGLYGHEVLSTVIDGDTATVEDCAVDESRLVDNANGETLSEGLTTTRWRVTLLRAGGTWRVDQFELINAWEGVVECE